jgi:pescadillo protein
MLSLFATLPIEDKITIKHIQTCQKLITEFQLYVIKTSSLINVFLSIKGIYYQCMINGVKITWIVPYEFSQSLPTNVDFRVMTTFLEVYETLVSFVNFRLWNIEGIAYPLKVDEAKLNNGELLDAYLIERNGIENDEEEDVPKMVEDDNNEPTPVKKGLLFANCTFYLSREVPSRSLQFIINAFGGKVISQTHNAIVPSTTTHFITDRLNNAQGETWEYLQPQWVYDSINAKRELEGDSYRPGMKLPAHLSPFVVTGECDYDPSKESNDIVTKQVVQTQESQEQVNPLFIVGIC